MCSASEPFRSPANAASNRHRQCEPRRNRHNRVNEPTDIQFIHHASLKITKGSISLLTDPWNQGDAFHKDWSSIYQFKGSKVDTLLMDITHLWISHEHHDFPTKTGNKSHLKHLSSAAFRRYHPCTTGPYKTGSNALKP